MKTSTVIRSLVTAAPYLQPNPLVKRAGNICGDLQGAYPNVQAPVCSGATSICTFAGSLQGCCDDQNMCQFYTTCIGHYAPETCVGSFCLPCPVQNPYCVKYDFWDNLSQRAYDGYSCADFQATQTIWGIATSIVDVSITSSLSSSTAAASSSTYSASSSEVPILTRFNSTQTTSSTFSSAIHNSSTFNSSTTISRSTATSSAEMSSTVSSLLGSATSATPVAHSKAVSHTGIIAGGVVGGIALLAIIVLGLICLSGRRPGNGVRKDLPYVGSGVGEVQQTYDHDRNVPIPPPWRSERYRT